MPAPPGHSLSNATEIEYRIRRIEEDIARRTIVPSPDIAPDETIRGTSLRILKDDGGGGEGGTVDVQLMRVFAVYDDHLMCFDEQQNADGTITLGSTRRYVLKPFELRRTPFHQLNWGNIYYEYLTASTRKARPAVTGLDQPQGTQIEYQVITPAYQVRGSGTDQNDYGSQILAVRNPGGLNSTYSRCTPPEGQPNAGAPQNVEWMEICSIRVWAEYSFIP